MTKAKPISDLGAALASLDPQLDDLHYEYLAGKLDNAVVMVEEPEGPCSLVAVEEGSLRRITLGASSSLDLVGLTAAVAVALTREGIPANIVAGLHHDHLFVPSMRAGHAMTVLHMLQRKSEGAEPLPGR